jgi:signal transduction histidine kinase
MTTSVVDAFDAMLQLSPDAPWVAQVRKRVAAALNGPAERREDALFAAYLEAERAIVLASNGQTHPEDLRRQLQPTFSVALGDYPDFALNFEPPERQFVYLSGELIKAWSREIHGALGIKAFEVLIGHALAGTNWKTLKVTVASGVEWNVAKLRSLAECIQMASALLESVYRGLTPVLGIKPARRSFERAYATVAARHPRLPVVKNLLGVSPLETLFVEKAQRLHDLETETVTQEHGLRAADEGLHRQAERLQQTVGELENTRERLEATSRAKDVFIDVVSHQFRTPLSTVRWNAELLYDEISHQPNVD